MHKLVIVFTVFIFYGCSSEGLFKKFINNFDRNGASLIAFVEKQGYKLEEHSFETEDGHNLTYHRLWPAGVKLEEKERGCPVLLQHGLATSSAEFLVPDRNALGYVLADAGYDVWLANNRGNRFSHTAKSIDSNNTHFRDLGLHELGTLDLAAGLDGVLAVTRRPRIAVVAHSHGVADVLALASSRPSYQPKLSVVLALAPAVFLGPGHVRLAEAYRIYYNNAISRSSQITDESANFPPGLEEEVCQTSKPCLQTLRLIRGTIPTNAWKVIKEFQPSGTSKETIHEVLQQIKQGPVFKHFDFGPSKNVKIYESKTPPVYDLPNIKIPIHIYFSLNDVFITKEDVQALAAALPRVTLHSVEEKNFNHFDFLWSPLAKQLVYDSIKDELKHCAEEISQFKPNQPPTYYSEKAMTKSPNGKLYEASLKFVRNLESLYGTQNVIYLHVFARLSKLPQNQGEIDQKNEKSIFNLDVSSKEYINNNDIQFIYEQFKILTNYSQMLSTVYQVNIRVTHDDIIEVRGFDELWKQVFLMYKCSGNKEAICDVLNTLREYRSLLTRPYLEIFSPAQMIKTNTHFFQNKLRKMFYESHSTENVDLSLTSVKHVIKRIQRNVAELRLLVVAINDIYSIFENLSAHKKYLSRQFDVLIKGNASVSLEIDNYHILENIDYSQKNCTYQCKEIHYVVEHLNKYKSVLDKKTIQIDNPKMYISKDIWSILIKATDAKDYPPHSIWEETENEDTGKGTLEDIAIRNMFQKLKRDGNIYFTKKEVDVLLYTTEYKESQKELLKNALYDIYETFRTLSAYKEFIRDRYKVMVMEDFFQQISVDNLKDLWKNIFHSPTQCQDKCLVIRESLEKIKKYKTLLTSNLIVVDKPKSYKSQGSIHGTDTPSTTGKYNTSKETSNTTEADGLMNDVEIFLREVREMLSKHHETSPNNLYDNQMENSIFSNLTTSDDTHVSRNNRNSSLNSTMYGSFKNSTYNLDSSNTVGKDISSIEKLLNDLKNTKETCFGKCKEKENILRRACKFQKHLYSTYFKEEYKELPLYCDLLLAHNSSFNLDNSYVNGAGRETDFAQQKENYFRDVFQDILQLSKTQDFVVLTENTVKTLYNTFKNDKNKIKVVEDIVFHVYDILQSLIVHKDYLRTEYMVSVTFIGPSTIRIDSLDFQGFFNFIQGRKDCSKECKEVVLILNKLQPYIGLFGKGGVIIDNPQKSDTNNIGPVKGTGNDNKEKNGESNLSPTSGTSLDAFLKQLKKYQTHIKSTYDLESAKPFTQEANNIESIINDMNKTKEQCNGDCQQMRDLYTRVCKFQKNLYTTYLDPIFRDNSLSCNSFTDQFTSNSNRGREFEVERDYLNNSNHSKTLLNSNLFHINELKDIANLTEQSITQFYKGLDNVETDRSSYTSVLYNIYDVLQSLLQYKDYLRTMYNVSITKIEPSTVYINQFNKLWVELHKVKHCSDPCIHIKSVLAKLRSYEDLYIKNEIIIDNPYAYLHLLKNTKPYGSHNNESKLVDSETLSSKTDSIIQNAIMSLEKHQKYIKSSCGTACSKPALKDIGEINNLLNRLRNTKEQCVGSCNEKLVLIKEVCQFQKYLHAAYSNENALKPNLNNYCDSLNLDISIHADVIHSIGQKLDNKSVQNNNVIETSNVSGNDVLRVILQSRPTKESRIVNLTDEVIDSLYKRFENDALKIEEFKRVFLDLYEVLNNLWTYKDYIQSTYGISVTKNEQSTIYIDGFNSLWSYIHDQTKLCDEQCNQIKTVLDKLKNYTGIITKPFIVVADPRRHQYNYNTIQVVNPNINNPNSGKYDSTNQHFNTTFIEPYSQTIKEETNSITTRLNKYLESLYSRYGIETSTSLTKDIKGIEQFLEQIKETKDNSTENSNSKADLIERVRKFLKHLEKTYLNKDNVNNINDLPSFSNDIKAPNADLFKIFHSDKIQNSINFTSKTVEQMLLRGNINKEVLISTLTDLYEAFKKLLTHKSYISSVYKVTIELKDNSKITVQNIDNLFNKSIQSDSMCDTTCLEVISLLKTIVKYKDYLRTNHIEIENPATYIDNHFWELLKQTNTQIEHTKPPKTNSFETNTNTNVISNPINDQYNINTDLWSMLRVNGNTNNTDLSASTVQKVLSKTNTTHSTKKYYLDSIIHIYESLKKLMNYKTYLEKNYNVIISINDVYGIQVSNFNQLLNIIYDNKTACFDVCIEIRQIMDTIAKYHSLINTKFISIDNPKLYLNINEHQANQNDGVEGLGAQHTPIVGADKENEKEIMISVNNNRNLDNIIERLKKYLVQVKSEYGTSVVATEDNSLNSLSELLDRIDNERARCLGNHCKTVEQLLKEAEKFQKHLNETYSNIFYWRPNKNIFEIINERNISSVIGSNLWSLLKPDNNKHVLDLSMNTVKERVKGGTVSNIEILNFVDIVYKIYETFLRLEPYNDFLRKNYDVAIIKTPQSKITVQNLKNLLSDTPKVPNCFDICLELENILKELSWYRRILLTNEKFEIDNPNSYIDRKFGHFVHTSDGNSNTKVEEERDKQAVPTDTPTEILSDGMDFDFGSLLKRMLQYRSNVKAKYDI